MSFKDLFSRMIKKAPVAESTVAPQSTVPQADSKPASAPAPAAPPVTPAKKEAPEDLDHAVKMLREITKALETAEKPRDVIKAKLPCKVALGKLPEGNRGPRWNPDQFPEATIEVPRQSLLDQLKLGAIAFPLSEFVESLPADWVQSADPDMLVEFDLEAVVTAIPPEWLTLSVGISDLTIEASQMHDYFAPQAAAAAVPESVAPMPEPGKAAVAEPVPPAELPAAAKPVVRPVEPPPPKPIEILELKPATPVPPPSHPVEDVPPMPVAAEVAPAPAVVAAPAAVSPPRPSPAAIPTPAVPLAPVSTPKASAPPPPPPPPVKETSPTREEPKRESSPEPVAVRPPPVTAPAAEAAAKPAPTAVVPPPASHGWDGIETGVDAAAHAVNINTADVAALEALSAVGPTVAAAIVADRQAHGPFRGVFDLARVPGIGYRQFVKMTGLDPKTRNNRHENLNAILGLKPDARPTLTAIFERARHVLGVHGCLLSNHDGMPLAFTAELADRSSDYAALIPQFFRRTDKYLRTLTTDAIHCVIVPISDPPLLLLSGEDMYLIFLLTHKAPTEAEVAKIIEFGRELNWLLGCRAVVRA